MSIESFAALPLNAFGTWVTLLDPSDVPAGMSPSLADIEFFPGGIRTRAGLVSQFLALGGAPQVNGLKTYINTSLVPQLIVFDSLGNLSKETSPGVLSDLASGEVGANLYMASTTIFGREYMAFGDGALGQDMPRQFDGVNFDRVSQIGPGEGPSVADSSTAGNISPGTHQCAVIFVTRQGFWTAPSPPVTWTAAGSFQATVTNIPTGPSNVIGRLLAFTASGGDDFYHVPATMEINDNTTTSLTVDFTDTILLSGTSMDYLFSQIELQEQFGVASYAGRLFWWGERGNMDNWRNLTFDGGWDPSGNGRPLGWQLDPSFGAGASREPSLVVWGDAFRMTSDGSTSARGMISQGAITDVNGNPLLLPNTSYSVRARVYRTAGLTAGTFRINANSNTAGQLAAGLAVTVAQSTTVYQEFTALLFGPQASLPADLTLRIYADDVPGPSGESFLVDNIEVFETNAPQNLSLVRASGTEEPEAYDGVSGPLSIAENNGQGVRAAFTLRNNLYFVKTASLHVTATDGTNEPALWSVEEVSNQVGTPSAHGVGIGEEWVVIAGRSGLYYFDGGTPQKLSQEIQPTWDAINWEYGERLWVQVDVQHKRILVGVPMGSATQPNQVLALDYTEGFGDPLVAMFSTPERSRKWTPWNIAANSCALVERANGAAQVFFGSNNASGKVYGLTPGAYSDDGAAINSFYSTAFLAATGLGPNQGWSLDNQITDGTDYARVSSGALTSGKIDPAKSGVLARGSMPPTWSGAFTYASTTSSIAWSWSGLTIYRADGTSTAIPNGTLSVSGLSAATTYYFYPYWDESGASIAWVASGAGTPANAQAAKTNFVAQQQALQGRVPLSQGAMVAATTSSGTGGGSGGGSGSCLRAGTVVLTKERGTVPIESCRAGEHLRCPSSSAVLGARHAGGEDQETWTRIIRLEVREADTFIRLYFSNAESLDVTPHHIFTLADGSPMRAERLCLSDMLVGRFGRVTLKRIEAIVENGQKVTVSCEPTHQFFAGRHAATVLTHNYTFSS